MGCAMPGQVMAKTSCEKTAPSIAIQGVRPRRKMPTVLAEKCIQSETEILSKLACRRYPQGAEICRMIGRLQAQEKATFSR